jgi:hypothetical protein
MNATHVMHTNPSKLLAGAGIVAAGLALAGTAALIVDSETDHSSPATRHGAAARAHALPPQLPQVEDSRAAAPSWGGWHVAGRPSIDPMLPVSTSDPAVSVADAVLPPSRSEADAPADATTPPRKITITLPQYHSGTAPTVTPPAASGTPPSVSTDDGSITITIPKDGEVTPPTYTSGKPGRLDPPGVSVE